MVTMEQVERLREKADVTYGEAKLALEACGDDLLDALIYLERQGKIAAPQNGGHYSTASGPGAEKEQVDAGQADNKQPGESFSQLMTRFLKWCGRIISWGNQNSFEVRRRGHVVMTMPVTVLVLLLVFAFWIVVPLIIIGFFFDFRYVFTGHGLEKTGVNRVMGTAADTAEQIKKDLAEGRKK